MRTLTVLGGCLAAMILFIIAGQHPACAAAKDPYVIGAVLDVTGTGSPLGTPEADTLKMLEKQINARGGINGHPVKVIIYDNASDEAKSVTAVKKLIVSDKVVAIIGPSQTGTTLAGAATVEAAGIPMISCAAGIKIVDPVKPWIFKTAQSDMHAVAKVVDYLKAKKMQKIALLTVANAFGESGKQQLELQAPKAKIQIVAEESFGGSDTDMTAQLMKIRRTDAQAIICWGTNPGPAIVAKNMQTLGIKLPVIMSHGVANKKFLELAGTAANGVILPAGKIVVAEFLPGSDKQKKKLLAYKQAFQDEYHREADGFGGYAYDAFHLITEALAQYGSNPVKLRLALEKAQFVGISGTFNFSADDHNGLAKDAFVMVKVVNGDWRLEK